jgi:hypothetical protein
MKKEKENLGESLDELEKNIEGARRTGFSNGYVWDTYTTRCSSRSILSYGM